MPKDWYELYLVTFPNGKLYLGISMSTAARKESHRRSAARPYPRHIVHRAMAKYGFENIAFRVLAVGTKAYIAALEINAIDRFKTTKTQIGYNRHLGGQTSPMSNPDVAAMRKGGTRRPNSPDAYIRAGTQLRVRWAALSPDEKARQVANLHTPRATATRLARLAERMTAGSLPKHHVSMTSKSRQKSSVAMLGRIVITNGKTNRRIWPDTPIPPGWRHGMTKRTPMTQDIKDKISTSVKRTFLSVHRN